MQRFLFFSLFHLLFQWHIMQNKSILTIYIHIDIVPLSFYIMCSNDKYDIIKQ